MCKEERCPMDAIIEEDGIFRVDSNRCIGCGVCSVTCPTESITLIKRLEEDYPPANLIEWSIERAKNRGIELKFE
jgi:Fe-S-cluster-containing hydrogenase component 2